MVGRKIHFIAGNAYVKAFDNEIIEQNSLRIRDTIFGYLEVSLTKENELGKTPKDFESPLINFYNPIEGADTKCLVCSETECTESSCG